MGSSFCCVCTVTCVLQSINSSSRQPLFGIVIESRGGREREREREREKERERGREGERERERGEVVVWAKQRLSQELEQLAWDKRER